MAKGRISFRVSPKAAKALRALAAQKPRPPFKVVGKVRRGKLEIDSGDLAAFTRARARKEVVFVALNAPFKTRPLIDSV